MLPIPYPGPICYPFSTDEFTVTSRFILIFSLIFSKQPIVFLLILVFLLPVVAHASFLGNLFNIASAKETSNSSANSQNMALLEATALSGRGEIKDVIVDDQVLMAEAGPLGTLADISDQPIAADRITVYIVRADESLSQIAKMFDVSVDTIRWANDLPLGVALKLDQVLIIPPISGVLHIVKKGDTIASVAKAYNADVDDITAFNVLGGETTLAVGDSIIVPDGKKIEKIVPKGGGLPTYVGYFMRPVKGGRRTTGIHGHNGIDIAAAYGTPVYAAADGKVIVSRTGWNGGFGNYVVINHPNGTQTLYAHNSSLNVGQGEYVTQGQLIAKMGSTGRSTGTHVHFEVHGAKNPF